MNNNSQQRNFLIEFEEKGLDLTQFKLYEEFLIECSQKNYDGIGTHDHHILPKGIMEGSNKKQNLITLSYQDHYNAHLILGNCFPRGDKRKGKNYASAKLIVGWVKQYLSKRYEDITEHWEGFWELTHKEVSELNKGENHPQYGDKYSPEKCQEMSERMKGKMVGELNPFFGKKHTEETKAIIREKRAQQVFSEESIEKRTKHLKSLPTCQSGENNPFYKKTWEERFGPTRAKELKEKMRIAYEKRKSEQSIIIVHLPEGLFHCDYIDEKGKECNIMRYCPKCNKEMYYKIKETPSYLNGLVNKNPKCKQCVGVERSKPLPEVSRTFDNSKRCNKIQLIETGEIFSSQIEFKRRFDIRDTEFKRMLKTNKIVLIKI